MNKQLKEELKKAIIKWIVGYMSYKDINKISPLEDAKDWSFHEKEWEYYCYNCWSYDCDCASEMWSESAESSAEKIAINLISKL